MRRRRSTTKSGYHGWDSILVPPGQCMGLDVSQNSPDENPQRVVTNLREMCQLQEHNDLANRLGSERFQRSKYLIDLLKNSWVQHPVELVYHGLRLCVRCKVKHCYVHVDVSLAPHPIIVCKHLQSGLSCLCKHSLWCCLSWGGLTTWMCLLLANYCQCCSQELLAIDVQGLFLIWPWNSCSVGRACCTPTPFGCIGIYH